MQKNIIVITEALAGSRLIEAIKDTQGSEWDVVLIEPGLSGNRRFWPESVLRESISKFDGVRALARADEDHVKDIDKNVKNIVGWFSNPQMQNGKVVARFHIAESAPWLRTLMVDAWEHEKKDIVGFSIVADGKSTLKRMEGALVQHVESIDHIGSVDVVVDPSAGGKILKLAASKDTATTNTKELEQMDKMLKLIESKRPDLYKKINLDEITEEEVESLLAEAMMPLAADPPAADPPAADPPAADPPTAKKLTEAQEAALKSAENIKKMECRLLLSTTLAEANLPAPVTSLVEARFRDRVFESTELIEAIKAQKEMLAKLTESGNVIGLGQTREMGMAERDKGIKALDGFFEGQDMDQVPRFQYFREAYEHITGDRSLSGRLTECINLSKFTEALTSASFGEILGDSITRKMMKEYKISPLGIWRDIVSDIVSLKDFRTNRRMQMGGYGTIPGVAQSGTYDALTSPTDQEETYAPTKRGGTEKITLEMIANDDQGAVRRIPVKLARAAAQTLFNFVFDILKNNPTLGADSKALFHADHNNLGTSGLSDTSMTAVRVAMRSQAAFGDDDNILGLVPKTLVVPNELEKLAWKITKSVLQVGSGESSARFTDTEDNFHRMVQMSVIVIDNWTDGNDWVAVCDPKDAPTIEIGFFNGKQEPELFVQDNPSVGSVFTTDEITYKIRHIYGGIPLDYRGMYKNVVA